MSLVVERIVDCPECHEECGWCSWYRKNARQMGCGSQVKGRKCQWGTEAKSQPCSLCGGAEKVVSTTTYREVQP